MSRSRQPLAYVNGTPPAISESEAMPETQVAIARIEERQIASERSNQATHERAQEDRNRTEKAVDFLDKKVEEISKKLDALLSAIAEKKDARDFGLARTNVVQGLFMLAIAAMVYFKH